MTTFKTTPTILLIGLLSFFSINTKTEYSAYKFIDDTIVDAYTLLKTKCLFCHQSSVEHDKRLAPPMFTVKRKYSNQTKMSL